MFPPKESNFTQIATKTRQVNRDWISAITPKHRPADSPHVLRCCCPCALDAALDPIPAEHDHLENRIRDHSRVGRAELRMPESRGYQRTHMARPPAAGGRASERALTLLMVNRSPSRTKKTATANKLTRSQNEKKTAPNAGVRNGSSSAQPEERGVRHEELVDECVKPRRGTSFKHQRTVHSAAVQAGSQRVR